MVTTLMLLARWMTFDTILKVIDALFLVLGTHFRFAVLVTTITGISRKAGRMTGRTGRSTAVTDWETVLSIEFSRLPCSSAMTGRTICSKLTGM